MEKERTYVSWTGGVRKVLKWVAGPGKMHTNELAEKRKLQWKGVRRETGRETTSFRRFWRSAEKKKGLSRKQQRTMIKSLWKALGRKPLSRRVYVPSREELKRLGRHRVIKKGAIGEN